MFRFCSSMEFMSEQAPQRRSAPVTLDLKLGRHLQAHATGWGVLVVPLIIALLLSAALLCR